jgi:hypothetical protein
VTEGTFLFKQQDDIWKQGDRGCVSYSAYKDTDGTEKWMHSAIITGYDDDGGLCFSAHSESRYNKPLSEIYPNKTNITEIRFLVPLHPTYYSS